MRNIESIYTSIISSLGLSLSIQNLESVFSIVLMVLSIINIVVMFALRLYDRIKDGKFTDEEKKETIEDFKRTYEELISLRKGVDNDDDDDK